MHVPIFLKFPSASALAIESPELLHSNKAQGKIQENEQPPKESIPREQLCQAEQNQEENKVGEIDQDPQNNSSFINLLSIKEIGEEHGHNGENGLLSKSILIKSFDSLIN